MFARWRAAGLLWPTVLTLLAFPVLVGLGTWQWHRLEWKQDLIAKLEARINAEPVPYTMALANFVRDGDVEYLRVRVAGTFDHAAERHLYAPQPSGPGWNVYTPLMPEGGLPPVYVNRGWVPENLKDPATRTAGQIAGPVMIVGIARKDDPPSLFAAPDDPKSNRWYSRNTWKMRWGDKVLPGPDDAVLTGERVYAPFSIDAEAEPQIPGGWPKGGTTAVHLPNSHLQYVVTWYALAIVLLVIFGVFARQRLDQLSRPEKQP